MPLEIRSTKIQEHGQRKATVELVISDAEEAARAPEEILLRVEIVVDHPYFRGIQSDAIKRAQAILGWANGEISKLAASEALSERNSSNP